MLFNSVLFFGRKNCSYSNNIKKYLKKKSLKFQYIESKRCGEKLKNNQIKFKKYDFIFSFRSFFILKKSVLKKCSIAAINFHPGPPEYRGLGCVNYALYQGSKFYGCTAHLMNDKIDNGSIIDVKKFKIRKSDTIEKCLNKTYKLAYKQSLKIFSLILKDKNFLKKSIKKNKLIKWSKKISNRKNLDRFYQISLKLNREEFEKKIRATLTKKYKPYIVFHKNKFFLK
jgi:methionyl-tRNA formyltransferase